MERRCPVRRALRRSGYATVTDGPFIETKEQSAGYFVVDCGSAERATETAGRLPDARFAAVEVRPLDGAPEA